MVEVDPHAGSEIGSSLPDLPGMGGEVGTMATVKTGEVNHLQIHHRFTAEERTGGVVEKVGTNLHASRVFWKNINRTAVTGLTANIHRLTTSKGPNNHPNT